MPSLFASCAGIDVQAFQGLVVDHLQDVRVPRDKQMWRTYIQRASDATVVFPRITADVLHQDVGFLALETQGGGVKTAQFSSVDITTDRAQRTNGCQTLGQLHCANVSGMPNLIALGEVFLVAGIPITMGVGQQTYAFHCRWDKGQGSRDKSQGTRDNR